MPNRGHPRTPWLNQKEKQVSNEQGLQSEARTLEHVGFADRVIYALKAVSLLTPSITLTLHSPYDYLMTTSL